MEGDGKFLPAIQTKVLRCVDWVQKQSIEQSTKQSLQNKNDIQFIIKTNADRKNFLLSAAEDEATVPVGVDEPSVEPKAVPLHKLRVADLSIECEWLACHCYYSDYVLFQKHVRTHIDEVHIPDQNQNEYICKWDVCGHKTSDFKEMVRHINYHAYHAKLLATGFNGRATLNLVRCNRDSTKRNQLPPLKCEHYCMWTGCNLKFNSIQMLFDHVRLHSSYSERHLCSWAGCGAVFPRRGVLYVHLRSHTGERLIACYHCGKHFANNRKLCDHLRRQNVYPNSPYECSVCGVRSATEYLLHEHARQHVSAYACTLCDMSAITPAALASHVRYRHLSAEDTRAHACPHCPYRAVTKVDLRKHIPTHSKKKKLKESCENSSDENSDVEVKKKSVKKYACHMCPPKKMIVFSRGNRLTTHLVKVHGAQWPFGHSRFRYQISEDGMYRLTTTRFEVLEVSKKIVDGYSGKKGSLTDLRDFEVKEIAEATEDTPKRFEIILKNPVESSLKDEVSSKPEGIDNKVQITMCDVDEKGDIIKEEVFNSDVVYG